MTEEKQHRYQTLIIAGFPCVGKSTFAATDPRAADSDSSAYSVCRGDDGKFFKNPNFPKNYIENIKEKMHTVRTLCVPTHSELIDYFVKENMVFTVVYPNKELKEEYIDRHIRTGTPRALINAIKDGWDTRIENLETLPCEKLELQSGEFLDARAVEWLGKLAQLRGYRVFSDIERRGYTEPIIGIPKTFIGFDQRQGITDNTPKIKTSFRGTEFLVDPAKPGAEHTGRFDPACNAFMGLAEVTITEHSMILKMLPETPLPHVKFDSNTTPALPANLVQLKGVVEPNHTGKGVGVLTSLEITGTVFERLVKTKEDL